MQYPLFKPSGEWEPVSLGALPEWQGAKRVGIDTETHDSRLRKLGCGVRRDGYAVGYSFAIEDGPKFYLPIRHEGGDNLDESKVLAYLKKQASTFEGQICGQNLSYDLDYWWQAGIEFPRVEFYRDCMILDPLIYELHERFSMAHIAARWGVPGKDEADLKEAAKLYGVDPKSGLWRLPSRYVAAYAERDAEAPLQILRRQEKMVEAHNLWEVYNLESQLLPVLVRMRRRGVRVDQDRLAKIETWTLEQEAQASEKIYEATGVRVGVEEWMNAGKVAPALRAAGIELGTTETGKDQIDRFLLNVEKANPVAQAIQHGRKVTKLRTTFAESIRRYMVNGRIHCTFHQIAREDEKGGTKGARPGRLSASDPNMQQQPAPDRDAVLGKMWRSIFLPEEGMLWGCSDLSQQEPRWTTHFAVECGLQGAEEAAAAYRSNPNLDNHQFMSDLTGLKRTQAKAIYLGLCYGEGGGKMCHELGLPTRWALSTGKGSLRKVLYFPTRQDALAERVNYDDAFIWEAAGPEGQEIIDKFDARAPFIRRLAKKASEVVARRGYVMTAGGRRLHFTQRQDGSYIDAHKGLNRIIQGTAADQVKKALVLCDRAGHFIQLQIHDEIDGSYESVEQAKEVSQLMIEALPSKHVPFKVDTEIGPSWGELEKI